MFLFSFSGFWESIKEVFDHFNYIMGAITAIISLVTWIKLFYLKVKDKFSFNLNFNFSFPALPAKSSTKKTSKPITKTTYTNTSTARYKYKSKYNIKDILGNIFLVILGLVCFALLFLFLYLFVFAIYKAVTEPLSDMQVYQLLTLGSLIALAAIVTIIVLLGDFNRENIGKIWLFAGILIGVGFMSTVISPDSMPTNEKGIWIMTGFYLIIMLMGTFLDD